MRLFFSLLAAVVLAVLVLAGCNSKEMQGNAASGSGRSARATTPSSSSAQNVPSDGVRRITTVELRDALDKGTAIVIDTRPVESYKQSHIKGSISVPVDQVANHINELPRDKMIVAYCSWPNEHTSARAAQILKEQGIENTAALLGGTNAWVNAGLPMESGNWTRRGDWETRREKRCQVNVSSI